MVKKLTELSVNWFAKAWELSDMLSTFPRQPVEQLNKLAELMQRPAKLTDKQRNHLIELHELIGLHIAIHLRNKHGLTFTEDLAPYTGKPDNGGVPVFDRSTDPGMTLTIFGALADRGVKLPDKYTWAFSARVKLARLLIDKYASDAWQRELPLTVAAIGGDSVGRRAQMAASQPRGPQRNELKADKIALMGRHPNESWKELLERLQADGRVLQWDALQIQWQDDDLNIKTRSTGTFKNWKPG